MSSRREASTPPTITGYEYTRLLGMGGFADVFLYRQLMPRRPVAVKVLLASSLDDEARARFRTEADLMATLSHHPSIVTVLQADVAPDGRPYLVMEYCSRPGLGQRYRAERMGVAEVLRIGVRLAGAVETAHRAGILHRDIKPANVLITDFGWPALTDFGIAATTGLAGTSIGMSIPWSPPEMLAEEPEGDVRADVYSLAATVYSLLARRSPFEVPDGSNSAADLIARIERVPVGHTGRGDVPDSLQAVLVRAMAKAPAQRHHSALAFARALQQVEAELMLPLTPLDLPEDVDIVRPGASRPPEVGEAGQATRLRPVRTVHPDEEGGPHETTGEPLVVPSGAASTPEPAPERGAAPTSPPATAGAGVVVLPGAELEDVPAHWRQATAALADPPLAAPARTRHPGRTVLGALAGTGVVAAVVVAAVLVFRPGGTPVAPPVPTPTPSATSTVPGLRAVPSPTDVIGTLAADGSAAFTWSNPDPSEGDRYLWGVAVLAGEPQLEAVDDATVTVPGVPDGRVCIEVSILRTDGRFSTRPTVGCVGP